MRQPAQQQGTVLFLVYMLIISKDDKRGFFLGDPWDLGSKDDGKCAKGRMVTALDKAVRLAH